MLGARRLSSHVATHAWAFRRASHGPPHESQHESQRETCSPCDVSVSVPCLAPSLSLASAAARAPALSLALTLTHQDPDICRTPVHVSSCTPQEVASGRARRDIARYIATYSVHRRTRPSPRMRCTAAARLLPASAPHARFPPASRHTVLHFPSVFHRSSNNTLALVRAPNCKLRG